MRQFSPVGDYDSPPITILVRARIYFNLRLVGVCLRA